jgi:hypothetical protein
VIDKMAPFTASNNLETMLLQEVLGDEEEDEYDQIVSSIDTLPLPAFVYNENLPEFSEEALTAITESAVAHVMPQLLALSVDQQNALLYLYDTLDYAAWAIAGFEGP